MEQRSALPSLNGKDQPVMPKAHAPETRPTSSVSTGGRRALGTLPKSASVVRRTRHSDVVMPSSWQPPHENQVQRSSTPRDGSTGRVSTSTTHHPGKLGVERDAQLQQQAERLREPEDRDSRDEVMQLRDENATFRRENDLLRTMLVEKMRGQSKVVAGGQFRAASASTVARVSVASSSACTKCSTARTRAIKAHQETEQAEAATSELRKYVDHMEAAQQRLWEERSSLVNEIAQLRDKLAEKVEECFLVEAECTKLDKQVKMWQPENDMAELPTRPLKQKEVVDNATQCTFQQRCDDELQAVQVREIVSLKAELQLLVQQLDASDQGLQRVSKDLEEARKVANLEKEQRDNESSLWRGERSEYKRRILELEESEKTLRISIYDLQHAHQKELQLSQKANLELRADVVAKEADLQLINQQHKTETSARQQQQQTLVKALKVRIEHKVADVDRLHALLADHNGEKAAKAAMKEQIQDLEVHVQTLTKENAKLIADNHFQQQQAAESAQIERDKLLSEGAADQRRLSEALSALQSDNRSLQTRISGAEAELAEQEVLMLRQKRSHARAMERLLESSLRLCVVAPTVNVQLNTNAANLAGKISSSISTEKTPKDKNSSEMTSVTCRSTPQQDSIRQAIENDVLPLFTSVFLQGDDDASPQADVPMTRWLQDLLHDMQERIAAQLESIYSTASCGKGK
ncbi:hypothetical protein PHYPSEUDO_006471 [Phytophthora pseudosyringae]|uniref:Uncharacterized protein n=1 Tax=Phytophthora pseudosyringae TaxID=221518 RepID=A0A8T1VIL6_9STRA|nr:hypothetical protein PHYPSEUDO_006471 [Phytophthora pseudosyringae]